VNFSNLLIDLIVHKAFSLSEISTADYINLVGNYNHAIQGGREEIDPKLAARGYSQEVLNLTKQNLKHNAITSCGIKFKKHLSCFKYPLFGYVLTLFQNYERGQLPFEGSVSDQPAQIMDIFSLLESLKAEQETKLKEKMERNGRRKRTNSARTS
jgi:hypothetical protein